MVMGMIAVVSGLSRGWVVLDVLVFASLLVSCELDVEW